MYVYARDRYADCVAAKKSFDARDVFQNLTQSDFDRLARVEDVENPEVVKKRLYILEAHVAQWMHMMQDDPEGGALAMLGQLERDFPRIYYAKQCGPESAIAEYDN